MRKRRSVQLPPLEALEEELRREKYKRRYQSLFWSTACTLIVAAAVAILLATLCFPVLRIYGSSMTPTLQDGEIIFTVKTAQPERGEIIAFYYNNKILIKRVIGGPGDWIKIEEDGTVYVNEVRLEEPYLTEKALGECDLTFPYQVPDGKWFVLGDHRSTSVDSRSSVLGFIQESETVGRIVLRVWPLEDFGLIE